MSDMRIEKQLQNLRKRKNAELKANITLPEQVKNWVLTHRLSSRQKYTLSQFNFGTFLTFLPFAFGVSQFLGISINSNKHYLRDSYFQTNFPIFRSFQPKLNLETIEYILQSNTFKKSCSQGVENRTKKNKISVLFSKEAHYIFGQNNFLAKIKIGTDKKQLFCLTPTGLSCSFYLLPSGNFITKDSSIQKLSKTQTMFFSMDELPARMQGLKQNYSVQKPLSLLYSFENKEKIIYSSSQAHKNQTPTQTSGGFPLTTFFSIDNNLFFNKKEVKLSQKELSTGFNLIQKRRKPFFCNKKDKFSKNRFQYYTHVTQLTTLLQNFFIEKNITNTNIIHDLPIKKTYNKIKFLSSAFFLEKDDINEKILQEFEKKNISPELSSFRAMSGYRYPDTSKKNLSWCYKLEKNFIYGKSNVFNNKNNISLPFFRQPVTTFFSIPRVIKKYKYNLQTLPKICIETRNIQLLNPQKTQTIYTGPSIILDYQTAFDWKNTYQEKLRTWFHHSFSPLNPLVQFQENFFGNYYSGHDIANFSDFTTKTFLRLKCFRPSPNFDAYDWQYESDFIKPIFSQWTSLLHIPSTLKKQNKFFKGIYMPLSHTSTKFVKKKHPFLPLIELKYPWSTPHTPLFGKGNKYSSLFEFGQKGDPDFQFSRIGFEQQQFPIKKVSGYYKNSSSIFSSLSYSVFLDNWESITPKSWLILSQISFALFCFHVLKTLTDNYGGELLVYLLEIIAALGILDESLKKQIEIMSGQRPKGFRVVFKSQKKFAHIIGIQKLLLEIYEVVLFLKNSARDFALRKTMAHGILLTGPPGTGKTLLVQAIAGEAEVPIVVVSGSSLIEPGESAAFKLQMAFEEARQIAPCIVFIDEVDTVGLKRTQITQHPMTVLESFQSFLDSLILESSSSFKMTASLGNFQQSFFNESFKGENKSQKVLKNFSQPENEKNQENQDQQEKKLSVLSQLLIELDGVKNREGVIVIAATNRPEVLDPALFRAGRFEKIIQVSVPDQQQRVEILQFYGKNIGYQKYIPWYYLGERTAGFTAADLSTLMNESSIKAILNESSHTISTIEHGIDRLTTMENEKYTILKRNSSMVNSISISSKIASIRLAYYQAGKILCSYALETHPKSLVATLWPRRPTIRSIEITKNLQNSLFEFTRLCEFTDRLIGCYAGKASLFLFLQKFASKGFYQTSTLGLEDLMFAQKLIHFILDQFFSKITPEKITLAANHREFKKKPEKVDFYTEIVETIQKPPMWKALEANTSWLELNKKTKKGGTPQTHYSIPWWLQEISDEFEFKLKNSGNGSRLYLYNPERTQRNNPEWFPPDEFFHTSSNLKSVKKAFLNFLQKSKAKDLSRKKKTIEKTTFFFMSSEGKIKKKFFSEFFSLTTRQVSFPWNDIEQCTRDYTAHSLCLQTFNKALVLLNQNRELLDRLVIELVYQEILRKPEIENTIKDFAIKISTKSIDPFVSKDKIKEKISFLNNKEKNKNTPLILTHNQIKIVEFPWGLDSRKPLPRWIHFTGL